MQKHRSTIDSLLNYGFGTSLLNTQAPNIAYGASSLRLTASTAEKMLSFTVYGDTVNGAGVGEYVSDDVYEIPCTLAGKNLINHRLIKQNNGSTAYISFNSDGSVTFNNSTSNILYFNAPSVAVAAGSYTLSADPENHSTIIYMRYSGDNYQTSVRYNQKAVSKSFSGNAAVYLLIVIPANTSETLHIQLEAGAAATDFEKYTAPSVFSLFSDAPLFDNDKLCIKPKIEKAVKNPGACILSDMQQWDSVPDLHIGTNILTVNTTTPPSMSELAYF